MVMVADDLLVMVMLVMVMVMVTDDLSRQRRPISGKKSPSNDHF